MVFRCTGCGDPVEPPQPRCPACGSFPMYRADEQDLARAIAGQPTAALPSVPDGVRMGEGGTPLVALAGPGTATHGKLESLQPTCSFKDRGSALVTGMAAAADTDVEAVVVASTGNTSSSVAAYAARADIPCAILVPAETGSIKLSQAAAHGAAVFQVDGSFSDCFELAAAIASDERIANATAVYSANPYVASANRTVAFELVNALGEPPDWITVPVGAGPLLGGIHAGFVELLEAGLIAAGPRLCGVQAVGCHPIARAWETESSVAAWDGPIGTAVDAIADPLRGYAADGEHTRTAIAESDGTAVALPDEIILDWQGRLASESGIYAEPASAAAVAAIDLADAIPSTATTVAVVTGHGLKSPAETAVDASRTAGVTAVQELLLSDH